MDPRMDSHYSFKSLISQLSIECKGHFFSFYLMNSTPLAATPIRSFIVESDIFYYSSSTTNMYIQRKMYLWLEAQAFLL